MPRTRPLFTLLLFFIVGMLAVPTSAQDASPFPDLSQLPGLQAGVNRAYALDFSQMEPEAAGSTPAEYRDALFLAGIVLEFDSETHAADAYGAFVQHGIAPLAESFGLDSTGAVDTELDDLGDQAHAFSIHGQTESTEGYMRYVVMQQGTYLFASMILTEAEESSLDADALLAYFSGQVDSQFTGLGEFDEEGNSSGGLWEFFPPADHALYAGLVPSGDEVMYPQGPA